MRRNDFVAKRPVTKRLCSETTGKVNTTPDSLCAGTKTTPDIGRFWSHRAPNESIVQNHWNIALLNVFYYLNGRYPLKIFRLFGFSSWKSSDPKIIIGIETYLFENFSQKKGSRKSAKIMSDVFRVKIRLKMGNYTFSRCSKTLGEAGKQEILQQMFRKL